MQPGDIVKAKSDIVTLYADDSVTEAKAGTHGTLIHKWPNGVWLVSFPDGMSDCCTAELEVIRKGASA